MSTGRRNNSSNKTNDGLSNQVVKDSKGANMNTNKVVAVVAEQKFNLTKAAEYLGVDPHFLRKLVHEQKIAATQELVPGTKIVRYVISKSVLDARREVMNSHKPIHLPEGWRKFIYRGPVTLLETIMKEHPEAKEYFVLANPAKED